MGPAALLPPPNGIVGTVEVATYYSRKLLPQKLLRYRAAPPLIMVEEDRLPLWVFGSPGPQPLILPIYPHPRLIHVGRLPLLEFLEIALIEGAEVCGHLSADPLDLPLAHRKPPFSK